jgi:hypothetical protein
VEVSKRLGRLQWTCEDVEEGCGGDADQRWGEICWLDLAQGWATALCEARRMVHGGPGSTAMDSSVRTPDSPAGATWSSGWARARSRQSEVMTTPGASFISLAQIQKYITP